MLRLPSFGADFLQPNHAGEAGFVLERLVGLDDALDVVVGEKALGALAGDLVHGVDEQNLVARSFGLAVRQMTTQASIGEL